MEEEYVSPIKFTKPNRSNKRCKRCNCPIYDSKSGYCKHCLKIVQDIDKIKHWLETGETGYCVSSTIRNSIRWYILCNQGRKCAICGIPDNWNGMKLNFVLDHIDGNAANNDKSNLRLICPNCDSQLDTFKSKNKNSARKFRNKYA